MIKRIKIENFRSFVKAEAELQPFTLVIGANGAGKSNLLRWFRLVSMRQDSESRRANPSGTQYKCFPIPSGKWAEHIGHVGDPSSFAIEFSDGTVVSGDDKAIMSGDLPWPKTGLPLFNLVPETISGTEKIVNRPVVDSNGAGTVQVLDALKSGDREDLFDRIEENFRRYVPEAQKLSLLPAGEGKKVIQVREAGLKKPLPASELSEGTRLILCILTIIHQENPPPVILLEDIDRGMHPRLFEQIAPLMRQIAQEHDINIIATTHNPYLVDAFQDAKECVLLVEKVDGASILVPLTEKLEGLDYDKEEAQVSLGELWYSGLVGGVPLRAKR
jgi:predicted ATPase